MKCIMKGVQRSMFSILIKSINALHFRQYIVKKSDVKKSLEKKSGTVILLGKRNTIMWWCTIKLPIRININFNQMIYLTKLINNLISAKYSPKMSVKYIILNIVLPETIS